MQFLYMRAFVKLKCLKAKQKNKTFNQWEGVRMSVCASAKKVRARSEFCTLFHHHPPLVVERRVHLVTLS